METKEFKTGDVVYLKSGGPAMTVVEIRSGFVLCTWYNGKEIDKHDFLPGTLDYVKE